MSKDWRSFVYGGIASMIAEFVTFPLDTTKTRLQLQGQKETTDKSVRQLRYKGMFHALTSIVNEEGVKALYSGIRPALLRQATYGSLKFGIYQTLKSIMKDQGALINPNTGRERVLTNVACAACAGSISSAIANPTDVLKVRLQQHPDQDQRLYRGFYKIYKFEGVRGLWRGVFGTAQRAGFLTSVSLPSYDYFKESLIPYLGDEAGNHFMSAALASFTGSIVSTPFDVIRTRVMEQTLNSKKVYKGVFDCFVKTVRNEGILALYKGLIPIYLRMGPWNITFFVTYEQIRKIY